MIGVEKEGINVNPQIICVYRYLKKSNREIGITMGFAWPAARPTVMLKTAHYRAKIAAISAVL